MHPDMEISQLIGRFFKTLHRWDWRHTLELLPPGVTSSVQLIDNIEASASQPISRAADVPIVSVQLPLDGSLTATPHVTSTTSKIIKKELWRAYKISQQIDIGKSKWGEISESVGFFSRHKHYLQFDFMAASEELLDSWCSWGRERMQDIVRIFETVCSDVTTLRPWPEWIEFEDPEWPHAKAVFFGLHLHRGSEVQTEIARKSVDLREPIVKFLETIKAWPEAERHENHFELTIRHVRAAELGDWIENHCQGLLVDGKKPAAAGKATSYEKMYDSILAEDGGQQCSL